MILKLFPNRIGRCDDRMRPLHEIPMVDPGQSDHDIDGQHRRGIVSRGLGQHSVEGENIADLRISARYQGLNSGETDPMAMDYVWFLTADLGDYARREESAPISVVPSEFMRRQPDDAIREILHGSARWLRSEDDHLMPLSLELLARGGQ